MPKKKYYASEKLIKVLGQEILATRANNDVNENPRWVVHFGDLGLELNHYQDMLQLKRELEKLGYESKRWSNTSTYMVLKHDEIITEYDHKREQYGISEDERVNTLLEEYKQYRQRCGIDKIKQYHGLNKN